jgi:phage-related minor tail protein
MENSEIAARLETIEAALLRIEQALPLPTALSLVAQRLKAIDARLADRVPIGDVRQAIEDVFATHGLVAQLREVYTTQRDEISAQGDDLDELAASINRLLTQLRGHASTWKVGDADRRRG